MIGPSRTAERVALRRAAHQLLDHPRVHDDPLALVIVGDAQAAALRAEPHRFEDGPVSQRLRAFLAVRSRVAEDTLARAVAAGVRQYVVLGAGLDTFAYRNPYPALRVFEVDHPATQAWKRRRLADAQIAVPDDVTFVALDFASESLPAALRAVGVRGDVRLPDRVPPGATVDVGVSLRTPPGERGWLFSQWRLRAPSGMWFGPVFWVLVMSRGPRPTDPVAPVPTALYFPETGHNVAGAFRGFFEPDALMAALRDIGFRDVVDLSPDELNPRFLSDRTDGLRVGSVGHIATALA